MKPSPSKAQVKGTIAPGIRIERDRYKLAVYRSDEPRARLLPRLAIWFALVGLVAFATHSSHGFSGWWFFFSFWPVAAQGKEALELDASRVRWRFRHPRWRRWLGWSLLRQVPATMVRGLEIVPVYAVGFALKPAFQVRAHLRARGSRRPDVVTVIDRLPTEGHARELCAQLDIIFHTIPTADGVPLSLERITGGIAQCELAITPEALEAAWGWPKNRLDVTDRGIRVQRRFAAERVIDADDIVEVMLVPSARDGSKDLVLRLRKGEHLTLLGPRDPFGLAERIADDVRRLLRLPSTARGAVTPLAALEGEALVAAPLRSRERV